MTTIKTEGFFSYAHSDDYRNRLQELREDLCAEYHIITGHELTLFIDRVGLTWGKEWETELSASLDRSSFFVPVLSPSYFGSEYCRKELTQFLSKVKRQRGGHLILPILFAANSVGRHKNDELLEEVMKYQYEDWTELRLASRDSGRYRSAVNRMAFRLARANAELRASSNQSPEDGVVKELHADGQGNPKDLKPTAADSPDDSIIAAYEAYHEGAERAVKILAQIAEQNNEIGRLSSRYAPRIAAVMVSRDDDADALPILRDFATELLPVAVTYDNASQCLFQITFCMDQSVRTLADARVLDAEGYSESMSALSEAALDARHQLEGCHTTVRETAQLSRLLRNPLSIIDHAITECLGAIDVMLDWRGLRVVGTSEIVHDKGPRDNEDGAEGLRD